MYKNFLGALHFWIMQVSQLQWGALVKSSLELYDLQDPKMKCTKNVPIPALVHELSQVEFEKS